MFSKSLVLAQLKRYLAGEDMQVYVGYGLFSLPAISLLSA